jgi:hypothetical protein
MGANTLKETIKTLTTEKEELDRAQIRLKADIVDITSRLDATTQQAADRDLALVTKDVEHRELSSSDWVQYGRSKDGTHGDALTLCMDQRDQSSRDLMCTMRTLEETQHQLADWERADREGVAATEGLPGMRTG